MQLGLPLFNSIFRTAVVTTPVDKATVLARAGAFSFSKSILLSKNLFFGNKVGEKPCAVVKGAPVVLLNLPLVRYQNEIHRCHNSPIEKKERTLYQHFIKPEAEKLVACYLENQVKKVTLEEKNYFGFIEKELAGTALT